MTCNFRRSLIHLPNSDESSSGDEYYRTNECLLRKISDGHKRKVVRKSRKSRKQKAVSSDCKWTSTGVQTESNKANNVMIAGQKQPELTCDNILVSTGTQTDDVIVVSVSEQLHASSDVPDGLFKSGHSGLLPAIHLSDEHSARCGRDTDSGHMSDTENRLLSPVATESTDHEGLNRGTVTRKLLPTLSVCRGSEEMKAATVIQPTASARQQSNTTTGNFQCKNADAVSQKLPLTECSQLSRWVTATRLHVLEDDVRQPRTFFASLETSDRQQAASNDADVSGISVLSNHKESSLPLLSYRMLTVNSETESSVDHVHPDIIVSPSNSQAQSSADAAGHVSKVLHQPCGKIRLSNSSSGTVSRPSVGTHRRVSKGLPQSHGKPRLSVGRKSLSQRRSSAVRDKCHPPTKISRPAAWLMSAARASRNKVRYCCFVLVLHFFGLRGSEIRLQCFISVNVLIPCSWITRSLLRTRPTLPLCCCIGLTSCLTLP